MAPSLSSSCVVSSFLTEGHREDSETLEISTLVALSINLSICFRLCSMFRELRSLKVYTIYDREDYSRMEQ